MADDDRSLRPETCALDALIQATIERAQTNADTASPDTMLFMGNWHQAIPSLVIQDPILEPVDKVVWMVIMLQGRETGSRTAFPSYETLADKANISSTSTIARAIAILRITRWLSLCARVRSKSGQFKGNVYVLHDEPLPFVDALHLDSGYMQFVEQSLKHHHARVRAVAQGMLDSLDEDIQSGQDICFKDSVLERRAQFASTPPLKDDRQNHDSPRRYFSFSASALNQLSNGSAKQKNTAFDQNQNSKADKSNQGSSSGCSSYFKDKNTTTTTQNNSSDEADFQRAEEVLIYPPRLSDNQQVLAERYLLMIEPEERQFVLDELQGRLESEQKGMKPVYDELRFLHSLCKAVQQGEFVPNLALKVIEARQERKQGSQTQKPERPDEDEKTPEQKQQDREFSRQQLAQLRKSMGMDKTK